jgi:hypothetical protein
VTQTRTSSHGRPQTTRPNDNLAFLIWARSPGAPNDPPERVHTGALKRPARTTETNDKGERQTSCTNVHKANLGSQLSIFDTGSFARARPRPNDPPERVHTGALKRPARTTQNERVHKGELKRPAAHGRPNDRNEAQRAKTSGTKQPRVNLAFLIRARSPGRALARTTRPNEFTRVPSNDPPERPKTNRQGRAGQTSCTNVHKANLGSQLSIFDTGSFARARPRPPERVHTGALKRPARTTHPNDPPERPARTSSHGRPQTTRPNEPERVHTGALKRPARTSSHGRPQTTRPNEFTRAPSNDPPERVHKGALKRPARTTHPHEFTRAPSNDPPERVHTGALKRPARTTHPNDPPERVHTGALKRPARTSSHGRPQTTRPNEFTRAPSNDPPERPTRTTRPHEFTRAPSNDPPERVHTGTLKRPAQTIFHGRPNDRNEPTRESRANELHERAQSQPRVTT